MNVTYAEADVSQQLTPRSPDRTPSKLQQDTHLLLLSLQGERIQGECTRRSECCAGAGRARQRHILSHGSRRLCLPVSSRPCLRVWAKQVGAGCSPWERAEPVNLGKPDSWNRAEPVTQCAGRGRAHRPSHAHTRTRKRPNIYIYMRMYKHGPTSGSSSVAVDYARCTARRAYTTTTWTIDA